MTAGPQASRPVVFQVAPPGPQVHLSAHDLARAAGIGMATLTRIVRLGLVEPVAPGATTFTAEDAVRLRRMVRLHADLGVNYVGAAIIVDILTRYERLEDELARLHSPRGVRIPIDKESA